MEVKFLSNMNNPLKKMGILSQTKKDSKKNSPGHRINGVVKFKMTVEEADAAQPDPLHSNGDAVPVASDNSDCVPSNGAAKVSGIVRSNGSVGKKDGVHGNGAELRNHGNQLSHVGSERRKWFVSKPFKSLGE